MTRLADYAISIWLRCIKSQGARSIQMASLRCRAWVRGIIRGSGYLLAAALVVAFLFILISSSFLGWRFDAVLTGSMSPTFKVGGMVVILPVDPLTVEVGDVVTYKVQRDLLVTHRVVEVIGDGSSLGFKTKGDGVEKEDGYIVPSQNVVGKVWFYVPLFGLFAEFVKSPIGLALCLILPGALLIWGEYRRVIAIAARQKGREQRQNYRGMA